MIKSELFKNELEVIQDEDLRMVVKTYLEQAVPNYFYEIGASSSGKFHPCFSQGFGGLVRHTKAVCLFAQELMRMSSYMYMKDEFKDYVFTACIIHDTCKYGVKEFDKEQYKNHAINASDNFKKFCEEFYNYSPSIFLLNAVESHMGQWSEKENRPFTNIDRCVHMADYMASRNFIDIPSITEEWTNTILELEPTLLG